MTVVDHALKKPVCCCRQLKKPYKKILDFGDAVPTSHGVKRRINMGREFEPALCAVLATGCDAQLQAGAAPGTGCADDFSPRAVPGTGRAHNWIGDETPVEDSMAETGGCVDVSIRWTFPKRVTHKKRRIKRGTKLHSVQSTSKAATTEKVDCMSDHTLYGNNTISPSTTRETELPVGLKVLDDRASINSFPSLSSSSPISISMGKGMGDDDENKDIIPVLIGETRQGAAVLSTNELVTGQPDVVGLLDESETYREGPVVGDFCVALDGWYNYCDNCYHKP